MTAGNTTSSVSKSSGSEQIAFFFFPRESPVGRSSSALTVRGIQFFRILEMMQDSSDEFRMWQTTGFKSNEAEPWLLVEGREASLLSL
jgi:hypothetical protein